MFPGEAARLQVKKEAEECAIDMPAFAEMSSKNFVPPYPDYADSRRWDAAESGLESRHDRSAPAGQNVNKDGAAHPLFAAGAMTLKFSGRGSWEAYLAQFELLASATGWSARMKAVQLALSLTDDAAACLLLLSPEEREDYPMLVAALQRRFGVFNLKDSLRCEFKNRVRQPGESLRSLAHEIETLGRRAYASLPSMIQSELARDQFVHALTPTDLRLHVQLAHPPTLGHALEIALERETAMSVTNPAVLSPVMAVKSDGPDKKPAWAEELISAVKSLSVRPKEVSTVRAPPGACWGCGKPGHTLRRCPEDKGQQGNERGSV